MKNVLVLLLVLVTSISYGQTFEKKGRFVSDPLFDTIVTVFIGSDTTGGGGIGLISDGDTSYVYATSDCLTILADTIRLDGYLAFPASVSLDSLNTNYINYPATPRQPTSAGVTNTGTIYRDTSNVVAVDRCLPWTCNDSLDVILTDTTANVGIGTSTPRARLHVMDSFIIENNFDVFEITVSGGEAIIGDVEEILPVIVYGEQWNFYTEVTLGGGSGDKNTTIVADNGGVLNYTDGNQAEGYVLTSDASGNATWQDHTAWGEMGFGDSTSTQALTQNVWHVVTNGNEDLWASAVVDTHAVTYSNDSLIIGKAGTYSVHAQLSVDGNTSSIIRLGIYINGALACTCTGYQELTNNTVVQLNYINIDKLNEGDVLQVVITNTANNDDLDAISGKLAIHKL